ERLTLQTAYLSGEFQAPAIDPRLDRTFGNLQPRGNLEVRKILQVAQHDGLPQRWRQFAERGADQLAHVALLELAVRTAFACLRRQRRGVHVAGHRLAFLAAAPVVVDAEVAADADEPGLEVGAPIEGMERLEDAQKDVLREVFGLVMTPDEFVGDIEDFPPVQSNDPGPGLLIASQAALDQLVDCGVGRNRIRDRGNITGRHAGIRTTCGIITNLAAGAGCAPAIARSTIHGSVTGFSVRDNVLACDGVPLDGIARDAGTSSYVYSSALIAERYTTLDRAPS